MNWFHVIFYSISSCMLPIADQTSHSIKLNNQLSIFILIRFFLQEKMSSKTYSTQIIDRQANYDEQKTYFKVFVIMFLKIVFHCEINSSIKVNWTYRTSPNAIIFLKIYYHLTKVGCKQKVSFEPLLVMIWKLTLTFRPGVTGLSMNPLFFRVIIFPKDRLANCW